jgi:hypothetical protein
MKTAPMTALDSVNQMLLTIGEQPVNMLEGSGVLEAEVAKDCLQGASLDIQSRGWHFNTESRLTLSPDEDGHIFLPENCLRVDTVGCSRKTDVVQRGKRLYDRRNHSYKFEEPLTLDMVVMLDFDELPQDARCYIAIVAARRFQQRVAASPVLDSFTQQDELEARVTLCSSDAENADYNILTDTLPNAWTLARIR